MTEQDKKKIVALWQSGMSIVQIKNLFPVKFQEYKATIKEMKANGEFPTERKTTKEKIKEIFEEAIKKGETINPYEIANTYAIAYQTVRKYKSECGIKTGKTQEFKPRVRTKSTAIKGEIALGKKSLSQIAKSHNVSRQYVHELKRKLEEDGQL